VTDLSLPFTVEADLDLGRRIAPYIVERGGDVVIRRGDVPDVLEGTGPDGAAYQIRDRRVLLRIPGGPRYLIEDGRNITYAGAHGEGDREIAVFLLGSAWGALCYQRGLIPLHASAISVDGAIHAFTGPSGAGKSTLAAALATRGRAFFTDDVLLLDPARLNPEPLCFTGQKDLKLWKDAIALTGAERGPAVRSAPDFEKYYAIPQSESSAVAGRLANLIILVEEKERDGPRIDALEGGRAVTQLVSSVYRIAFANAIIGRRTLYEGLTKLVGQVRVSHFRRRFHADDFTDGVDFIDDWISGHA
jgi:hypothetical protein